jgi:hypothetical protein
MNSEDRRIFEDLIGLISRESEGINAEDDFLIFENWIRGVMEADF